MASEGSSVARFVSVATPWVIRGGLVVGAGLLLADAMPGSQGMALKQETQFLDDRSVSNGVVAASALLWPVLFDAVLGLDRFAQEPLLLLGLASPLLLTYLNLLGDSVPAVGRGTGARDEQRRIEAQTIISAAFAVGVLLFNASERRLQQKGIRLIMYAILLCVAVVIPQGVLGTSESGSAIVVRGFQRVALNYSIGLIISGVVLAAPRSAPSDGAVPLGREDPRVLRKLEGFV